MNFHVPGILIGFFVLGLFHRALRTYLEQNRHNVKCVCFYALTVLYLFEITNLSLMLWLIYAPALVLGLRLCRGNTLLRLRLATIGSTQTARVRAAANLAS